MKIVHTADLHLKQGFPARLEVLGQLLEQAAANGAELFVIAGDLFDSDYDADALRKEVRSLFAARRFQIAIVPGNHDEHSYSAQTDYGGNVILFHQLPHQVVSIGGMRVGGIPFQSRRFDECRRGLPPDLDLLVTHGTLCDASFLAVVADDERFDYLPIEPSALDGIARCVLLGHIHSRSFERVYGTTRVIYPGSPLALSTKNVEPRCYYQIDLTAEGVAARAVEITAAPYWQRRSFVVIPEGESAVRQEVAAYLESLDVRRILPFIELRGYTSMGDRDWGAFTKELEGLGASFQDFRLEQAEVGSWQRIAGEPLVQAFVARSAEFDAAVRVKMLQIMFPLFSRIFQ